MFSICAGDRLFAPPSEFAPILVFAEQPRPAAAPKSAFNQERFRDRFGLAAVPDLLTGAAMEPVKTEQSFFCPRPAELPVRALYMHRQRVQTMSLLLIIVVLLLLFGGGGGYYGYNRYGGAGLGGVLGLVLVVLVLLWLFGGLGGARI
jgi:hypothetical protein